MTVNTIEVEYEAYNGDVGRAYISLAEDGCPICVEPFTVDATGERIRCNNSYSTTKRAIDFLDEEVAKIDIDKGNDDIIMHFALWRIQNSVV